MTTDYRAAIALAPEIAAHYASLIGIKAAKVDGGPRGTDTPETPTDRALDRVTAIVTELGSWVHTWRTATADLGIDWPEPVTEYRDFRVLVVDDHNQAFRAANIYARTLLDRWDDIEDMPGYWDSFTASLDYWLIPIVKRYERTEIEQRPRRCHLCNTLSVWADMGHASGLCDQCGQVYRAEVWLSVKEAAERLSVAPRTVRRWVEADAVQHRPAGRTSEVEWGSCREHHELAEARRKLNLA